MRGPLRVCLILLLVGSIKTEEDDFVPIPFVAPQLSGRPHFMSYFDKDEKIGDVWVKSTAKKDSGDEEVARYDGDWSIGPQSDPAIDGDFGLIVKNKAKHHAIAAKLENPFIFAEDGKPLIVQYEVQFEEGQDCGGGYIKLLSKGAEKSLQGFQDKSPYSIMFGPDKCGPTGKVHLIFKYKNPKNGSIDEYHATQPQNIQNSLWDDHKPHLYKLVLKPSGDFEVSVDQKSLYYGNMLKDLTPPLTPPDIIADPEDTKPTDWDDRAEIEDETAAKPDDWDESQPKEVVDTNAQKPADWLDDENPLIPDPEAVQPSDWDHEMDGDWEAPMIDNPQCVGRTGCGEWKPPTIKNPLYKGKWRKPKVANPAYKGVWTARQIPNPHHFEPIPFAGLEPVTAIGIELWTMSSNIIFDNFLVVDDLKLSDEFTEQTYAVRRTEADRLLYHRGEGGVVSSIMAATKERPWLWVVFALSIILPAIAIAACCFGKKSTPVPQSDAINKKTDAVVPDDEVTEQLDDGQRTDSPSKGTVSNMEDMEDSGTDGDEEEDVPHAESDMDVGYEADDMRKDEVKKTVKTPKGKAKPRKDA
ncbi:unnamed protein product, partial [Mesorhabditis spiculigera]